MKKIILLLTVALSILYACTKKADTIQTPQVSCSEIDSRFSAKVFPIIQSSCATNTGCHATGSSNGPGALTNFNQISQASSAIKNAVLSGVMPKGSSLSIQDKNAIACWANSGAPNN